MNNRDIEDFYNGFVRNQINSGINDRIFQLYKRMLSLGLNTSSNVLELGCGIGTLTFLLSKKVKKGIIEAVDLSSDSILHSKNKINRQNILFLQPT